MAVGLRTTSCPRNEVKVDLSIEAQRVRGARPPRVSLGRSMGLRLGEREQSLSEDTPSKALTPLYFGAYKELLTLVNSMC